MSRETPNEVPFSLVCINCDAGMDIESREQAIAEGWTEISFEPHMPMANYSGLCPDCKPEWDRAPEPTEAD